MKKSEQKNMKRRTCLIARGIACVSFFALVVIGISSLVKAMSLETIENYDGIPMAWKVISLDQPDTITLPITYWDQKADACDAENRQFEWSTCGYWTHGVMPGIVKNTLGADGLPVPAYSDREASWSVNHDLFAMNVLGNDPVLPTDNFYRWFHEVPGLSKQINGKTVTFKRTGNNTYTYGGQNIYPLDDSPGLDDTDVMIKGSDGNYHNFNFTAHLRFAIKVGADDGELFEFSGDDDVWFFLNNQKVLDIGGLHGALTGWFKINKNGTLTTYVEKVNNLAVRDDSWTACLREGPIGDFNTCVKPYNEIIRANFQNLEVKTLDVGLKPGDVVNLDFFYAERSSDASNTKITITGMEWPISADSNLEAEIVGQTEKDTKLVQFAANVKNRDPDNPVILRRLAAYMNENDQKDDGSIENNRGFIPLSLNTLEYTTTPDDPNSWTHVGISAPSNSDNGFVLEQPITMAKAGEAGDTLYFRYYAETLGDTGNVSGRVSFYTELNGKSGITYDDAVVSYKPEEKPRHNLTIKYQWEEDGSEAAPDFTAVLPEGGAYNQESPRLEDGILVDEEQVIVEGVMGSEDITIIVKYRKKPIEEKYYRLVIRYKDIDTNIEIADAESRVLKAEASYEVKSPEIDEYSLVDKNQQVVTGNMPPESEIPENGTVEIVVFYKQNSQPEIPTEKPYTLTIQYIDRKTGKPVAPEETQTLHQGDQYQENSPAVPGYKVEPGREVIEGTMPGKDVTEIVYYDKITKHKVVIHYIYEDGSEAKPDFRDEYYTGDIFSVISPEIEGFKPDKTKIRDTVRDRDLEYTVIYKKGEEDNPERPKYSLVIKYVYEDGSEAKPDYQDQLEEGDSFDVKSPEIDKFEPDLDKVSGVMTDEDRTYVVVYKSTSKVEPSVPTISDNGLGSGLLGNLAQSGFLKPLSQVAYVPNTGVVSNATIPIFEQHFASAVMSQGFVLVILLVFAVSFAVYFKLRKHLNHNKPAKSEKTSSRNRTAKKVEVTKSAKSTAKSSNRSTNSKSTKTTKKQATRKTAKVDTKTSKGKTKPKQ